VSGDDLRSLQQDLGNLGAEAAVMVRATLRRGAVKIKEGMNSDLGKSGSFKASAAGSVNFDETIAADGVTYEIGPDVASRSAAALANIAYFGGARGGGGTVDIEGPMRAEEPVIVEYLEQAVGRLL
jgi:hypothetical protein